MRDVYDVVGGDTIFPITRESLDKFCSGVLFESGHEEDTVFANGLKPEIAGIAPAKTTMEPFGNARALAMGHSWVLASVTVTKAGI